jgi:hypothetical protein
MVASREQEAEGPMAAADGAAVGHDARRAGAADTGRRSGHVGCGQAMGKHAGR